MATPLGQFVYRRWLEEEEDCEAVALVLARNRVEQQRVHRRFWVKPWLQRRPMFGQYETLFQELDRESDGDYIGFIRMDRNLFAEVLQRVEPRIAKNERSRGPLKPGIMLAITLRYIATGNSYKSLEYSFRVSNSTIPLFIPKVCRAIYQEFKDELFVLPENSDQWRAVAEKFGTRWNFHHCCGAIDGKHIEIKKPSHSGSQYFNYKGYFFIILLAVVDADYKFLWCCTGAPRSASDAGVFNGSRIMTALEEGRLPFPDPYPLPGDDREILYFLVGDDAFALRKYMMKPFTARCLSDNERIFNYRLSRARRVVENAFGILAHRWRCLLSCMHQHPENVVIVVEACTTLHNLIRTRVPRLQAHEVDYEDDQGNIVPGSWRVNIQLTGTDSTAAGRPNFEGKQIRNYLMDYYNSDIGRLPWQDRMINL